MKEFRKELYKIFKIIEIKKENKQLKTQLANEILINDELAMERDFYKVNYEKAREKLVKGKINESRITK